MPDLNELLNEPTPNVELPDLDGLWAEGRRQRRNRNFGRGLAAAAFAGILGVGGIAALGGSDEATRIDGTADEVESSEAVAGERVFVRASPTPGDVVISVTEPARVREFIEGEWFDVTIQFTEYSLVYTNYELFEARPSAAAPSLDDPDGEIQTRGEFSWYVGTPDTGFPFVHVFHGDQMIMQLLLAPDDQIERIIDGLEVVDAETFNDWIEELSANQLVNLGDVGPTLRDHWHVAFGIYDCGTFLEDNLSESDPYGLHGHQDGLIHIHPFSEEAVGYNATLGLYADSVGEDRIGELASRSTCTTADGTEVPAEFRLIRWSSEDDSNYIEATSDWHGVHLEADGDMLVAALAPVDEQVPKPPSASALGLELGN